MDTVLSDIASYFAERQVAVTGGASFIGSHLVELLVSAGASVTVIDDLSSGKLEHLKQVKDSISFIQGDLRIQDFAEHSLHGAEIVFHLAAQHGGRGYIDTHPVECVNNMLLDHVVYSAAVKRGAKKIVFASSACVYPTNLQASTTNRLLLKESDANFEEPGKAFSDGEYGWAKLMGELQLRAFCKQYGISGVACRIFTAYGERENESHAVVALIAKAMARLDPFPIWGDGRQTRNFTYVKDTITGMALAACRLDGFRTINLGSSHHHSILDLIEEIFSLTGWRPNSIAKELDKPVGVLSRASDNSNCRQLLNWEPRYSLSDGLDRTLKWYRAKVLPGRAEELERLLLERS
jgi:UDP-glucose 4-epimerase